jgi:CBS domain containing-hemolysin-like protein
MSSGQSIFLILLIALNFFFIAVEFAVAASRRSRLGVQSNASGRGAVLVRKWLEDETARDRMIAASHMGITLASLALGAAGQEVFEAALEPIFGHFAVPDQLAFLREGLAGLPLLVSLAVVTSFHILLGEQASKATLPHGTEPLSTARAPVIQAFIRPFHGFISLLDWAARGVLGLFGLPQNGRSRYQVGAPEEVRQNAAGPEPAPSADPPERESRSTVINFDEIYVRQISIPRTEIIAVESTTRIEEAVRMAAENGVTRLPVYEERMDQITGILHLKDLLPALLTDGTLKDRTARELAREALFVPETISVSDLLAHMRARKQHMAITLDEFGGTAGLVTLEDLLEKIVGEVQDPFDASQPEFQHMPDGSALIDGLAQIEEVNQVFQVNLYDPNYDTIAGYMLGKLGRIAQLGDVVEDADNRVRLRVESMDRLRIARIHFSRTVQEG